MARVSSLIVRFLISVVVVSIPAAYLFYDWNYGDYELLKELSYEAFNEHVAANAPPNFLTYSIYAMLTFAVVTVAITGVTALLGRLIPGDPGQGSAGKN